MSSLTPQSISPTPKPLVYMIAPSSRPKGQAKQVGYLKTLQALLTQKGCEVAFNKNMLSPTDMPFHAAPLNVRFQLLKEALLDKRPCMIWAYWGGCGCIELIPHLMEAISPRDIKAPKLLVGFSDVTALHIYFNEILGLRSLHGENLGRIAQLNIPERLDDILKLASGEVKEVHYGLTSLNALAHNNLESKNSIKGTLVGGNLSLVEYSLGTSWQLQGQERLLFLEDIDERGYRVYERLTHLSQAGLFQGCQGVIFGAFTNGLEDDGKDHKPLVLQQFARSAPFPVFSLPIVGHIPENHPLPLGTEAHIHKNVLNVPMHS